MRNIPQSHLFYRTRNNLIVFVENRQKILNQGLTLLIDLLPIQLQLDLQHLEEPHIGRLLLQQHIALGQRLVVLDQGIEVMLVLLRDNEVDETSALLATPFNQFRIVGRDNHQGQEADMIRQLLIFLLVAFKLFPLTTTEGTEDLLCMPFIRIGTLDDTQILARSDNLRVGRIGMTLAE